ncbi:hypothetical protein ACFL2P_02455 [Candidatus Moduliflexota bacterium]
MTQNYPVSSHYVLQAKQLKRNNLMPTVAVFLLTEAEGQREIARAWLTDDGKLEMDEDAGQILKAQGIYEKGDTRKRLLTKEDGEDFLMALPYNFSGSYLRVAIREK